MFFSLHWFCSDTFEEKKMGGTLWESVLLHGVCFFTRGIRWTATEITRFLFSPHLYFNLLHCLFHPFQCWATLVSYARQDQWEQTTIKRCLHTGTSFNQQNQLNTIQILSRKPYRRERAEGKLGLVEFRGERCWACIKIHAQKLKTAG